MYILSQYKDYYDYLTGIYGIDEKIILDRRKFDKFVPYVSSYSFGTKVTVFICDKGYDGYFFNDKYYWGKNLLELLTPEELEQYNNKKEIYKNSISLQTEIDSHGRPYTSFSLVPYELEKKCQYNTKENCPIVIPTNSHREDFFHYPVLKDLNINILLPPHDIFVALSAWLAPKEDHVDTRTNKDKITGAGFDLKTSFRKM